MTQKQPLLLGKKLFLRVILYTLGFLVAFVVITLAIAGIFAYSYINSFNSEADTTFSTLSDQIKSGLSSTQFSSTDSLNFLIFGLDSVENKPDAPPLTDTIIFLSMDLDSGQVNSLSLPRDLWSDAYQTKINSLYSYGIERDPKDPTAFPIQVLEEMTGFTPDYVVTLKLEDVAEIIDAVGGVTIDVEQGFTDEEFPRSDVDPSSTDPEVLYETVVFESGEQTMNGETALKFMRSRKSADLTEGTDTARGRRQNQVIQALISKSSDRGMLKDPKIIGKLYSVYQEKFSEVLSVPDAISLGKELYQRNNLRISFDSHQLSIYPDDPDGAITHPKPSLTYQNQWVYSVYNLERFQGEIQEKLSQ